MRFLFLFLSVFLLVACERAAESPKTAGAGERDRQEQAARLETQELEKQLDAERREAEMLARREGLEEKRRQLEAWETEVIVREQALSEQELVQAGQVALEDWAVEEPGSFEQPVADFNLFFDGLQDHGRWFESPDYGHIFQPTVVVQDRSWRPYTRGRWICSDRGWMWLSEEDFGWATYHYGRWVLLADRGWCWVPGEEWAPSWVAWRHGGGHVGWAPLPPETLHASGRSWGAGVDRDFGLADEWFCFVAERDFASPIVGHCLPVLHNARLRGITKGCTNVHHWDGRVVVGGPSYAALRGHVDRPWPVRRIENDPLRGLGAAEQRRARLQGDRCQVFAPRVGARWNPTLRPARVAGRVERGRGIRAADGLAAEGLQRFRQAVEQRRRADTGLDDGTARQARLAWNRAKIRQALGASKEAGKKPRISRRGRPLPQGVKPTVDRREALSKIRQRVERVAPQAQASGQAAARQRAARRNPARENSSPTKVARPARRAPIAGARRSGVDSSDVRRARQAAAERAEQQRQAAARAREVCRQAERRSRELAIEQERRAVAERRAENDARRRQQARELVEQQRRAEAAAQARRAAERQQAAQRQQQAMARRAALQQQQARARAAQQQRIRRQAEQQSRVRRAADRDRQGLRQQVPEQRSSRQRARPRGSRAHPSPARPGSSRRTAVLPKEPSPAPQRPAPSRRGR